MRNNKERESTEDRPAPFANRVIAGALIYFGFWCCLDVITVKVLDYPRQAQTLNIVVFAFPIALFALTFRWFKGRVLWALAATMLACLITVPLIFVLGVPLHVAIGGKL